MWVKAQYGTLEPGNTFPIRFTEYASNKYGWIPSVRRFSVVGLCSNVFVRELLCTCTFKDKDSVTRDEVFNLHISHVWATSTDILHVHVLSKSCFSVNVWPGIMHDFLIGPLLATPMIYRWDVWYLLENVLPELLDNVLVACRNTMWFQHDRVPALFSINVRNYLDATFGIQCFWQGGPAAWSPRSSGLSIINSFLRVHWKALI